jgi:hypothetical protein
MIEPRNFQCEATGLPCIDKRCTRKRCTLEIDTERRTAAMRNPEMKIPRGELEKVARDWFVWVGKRPTKRQIENALWHPKVVAEAKRRAAMPAKWVAKISN